MAKVQKGVVSTALLEQLQLDSAPDGVEVDARTLHLVHDLAPFDGLLPLATFDEQSIDTTTVTMRDPAANSLIPGVATPGLDRIRYMQTVAVETDNLVGGIRVKLWHRWRDAVNGVLIADKVIGPDGRAVFGPLLLAPGMQQIVQSYTNGGIGEVLSVWRQGWSAPAGGSVPIVPGLTVTSA